MSEGFGDQSGNPYDPSQGPVKKKSSTGKILLIIGGLGLVLVLVCCGGFGLLMKFGMDQAGQQVAQQVQDNPVIQEHIGEISSCSLNFTASTQHQAETGEQQVLLFDLQGSKGSGTLRARMVNNQPRDASLELPSGEVIDLE